MRRFFKLVLICIFCPLAFYGQTDGEFDCSTDLPLRECNYIPNPSFNLSDPFTTQSAFSLNNVSGWYDTQGSTDINRFISPFDVDINFASMGLSAGLSGTEAREGIAAKIPPLVAGNTYAFSFFIASNSIFGLTPVQNGMINVALVNCQDFPNPDATLFEPLTTPNQVIYCETLGTVGNSAWKQVFVKFTATHGFNMIRIYPSQSTPTYVSSVSFIHAAYPELIDVTNFSTGSVQFENSCDFTIAPANCAVKNAVFTWRDPSNNIIQQGASQQLNGSLNNNPGGGIYTLSMTVPGATTTNTCSVNNPVISAEVNVPGNCNCGSLNIIDGEARYLSQFPPINTWYTQTLTSCETNNICNFNELIQLFASSTEQNGNVWEVFPGSFTGNMQFTNTQTWVTSNPISITQDLNLDIGLDPLGYGEIEIRLTSTITNSTRSLFLRIIPSSGIYSVCNSIGYPGYNMLLGGTQNPYTNYTWTFPSGMTLLPNANVLEVAYNESQYAGTYPINATLVATSNYGCPTVIQPLTLYSVPIFCNARNIVQSREKLFTTNKVYDKQVEEDDAGLIFFPNPTQKLLTIQSKKNLQNAILFSAQGVMLKQYTTSQLRKPLNIQDLKPGTYFIKIFYENNTYEVKSIIKQ